MLLAVRISSYRCTCEVWRALKKLELLSAAPRATLTHFSCSPNFPRASITRYTQAKHEQILNFPNQISPVSLFEYVLNRQIYVWEKPSDKRKKQNKKKNNFFPAHFSERWENHEPSSLSAQCFFFVIRTFTSFNLFRSWLCFALCNNYGVLYSNLKVWKT